MQNNKTYNIKQATEKIQHYCALQDRCQWEVKRKLQEYGLDDFVVESILVDLILEKGPLKELARAGELMVFRHDGFWHPMDTYRDYKFLNELWDAGDAPWKV